jgi:hypothetical protein
MAAINKREGAAQITGRSVAGPNVNNATRAIE